MEPYLNKRLKLQVTFQKYGLLHGTGKKTSCLKNIRLNGQLLIEHLWIHSETLVEAKLRTNQPITIQATIRGRKRPPENLFSEPLIDITLRKVILLTKGKKCLE